jgi:ATP-dependent DNA ligase
MTDDRYPGIAVTASKLRAKSFTLDGEAVVANADGVAVFDALHRRGRVTDAILQVSRIPYSNGLPCALIQGHRA